MWMEVKKEMNQYTKDDLPEVHIIHNILHHGGYYLFDKDEQDKCNCEHHIRCRGRV